MRFCLIRKRQHVGRVPLLQQATLACPIELLERVLAQGLQHREAGLGVEAFTLLDKTLADQSGDAVEDVETEVAGSIATRSAASSVQPPTKTPSRRKEHLLSGESRSWLHAIAARRVRWRSGASRAPSVSSRSR